MSTRKFICVLVRVQHGVNAGSNPVLTAKTKIMVHNILELKELKTIIESRLNKKRAWVDAQRGYNYDEYCRRELLYSQDENHIKLKKINQQIEKILKSI